MRQERDRHLAEEVTQAVFLALSQRARALQSETVLADWLTVVTRCAALNALKAESRRKQYERRAGAVVAGETRPLTEEAELS
jgi:DNA-directed RNA polymerase specialized sigma24 family protein